MIKKYIFNLFVDTAFQKTIGLFQVLTNGASVPALVGGRTFRTLSYISIPCVSKAAKREDQRKWRPPRTSGRTEMKCPMSLSHDYRKQDIMRNGEDVRGVAYNPWKFTANQLDNQRGSWCGKVTAETEVTREVHKLWQRRTAVSSLWMLEA